jgi:hypothetical protein
VPFLFPCPFPLFHRALTFAFTRQLLSVIIVVIAIFTDLPSFRAPLVTTWANKSGLAMMLKRSDRAVCDFICA